MRKHLFGLNLSPPGCLWDSSFSQVWWKVSYQLQQLPMLSHADDSLGPLYWEQIQHQCLWVKILWFKIHLQFTGQTLLSNTFESCKNIVAVPTINHKPPPEHLTEAISRVTGLHPTYSQFWGKLWPFGVDSFTNTSDLIPTTDIKQSKATRVVIILILQCMSVHTMLIVIRKGQSSNHVLEIEESKMPLL